MLDTFLILTYDIRDLFSTESYGSIVNSMSLDSLSILVAEDNRVNQLYIKMILEKAKHTVTLTDNGEDAIAHFKAKSYDLVLLDIQMPVLDGYETADRIRQYEAAQGMQPTPIIALTAYTDHLGASKSQDKRFDGFLSKPLDANTVWSTLEEIILKPKSDDNISGQRKSDFSAETYQRQILAKFSGLEDTLRSMLRMALDDIPAKMKSLEKACKEKDYQQCMQDAHFLANIAGILQREREQNCALSLETQVQSGSWDEAYASLSQLREHMEELTEAFRALLEGPLAE